MKRPVIAVAACVLLWGLFTVGSPMLKEHNESFPDTFNDVVLKERVKTFPTAAEAPESGDGEGRFVLPGWVPEDATEVKVKIETTGNAELIRFDLGDTPLDPGELKKCRAGGFVEGPKLRASWFTAEPEEGDGRADCSEMYEFRVLEKGGQVFAWSNGNYAGE
ncbi:hypothetical protein [Streptomyces sp. HNM0574]|uniref:hypothetical protein n=1 Tax=Streptomyces sp. HNM0574 TaxID=2714954 RepID=UPI00146D3122|nr:hypothetical protein [Streptomyces sp. HNM0574]NLU70405.1 hypothetical protein [Streptomyces sp. HNM0574]